MDIIGIYIENPMKVRKNGSLLGEWLSLPFTDESLKEVLSEIGISDKREDFFISYYEAGNFELPISPATDIYELNELAKRIDGIDELEHLKLAALIEWKEPKTLSEIYGIIDMMDDYEFLDEIQTDEELGRYMTKHRGFFNITPEEFEHFSRFDRLGEYIRLKFKVIYNSCGAIFPKK